MAIAVLVLILFGGAFAALAGQCSFSPTNEPCGHVERRDVETPLRTDARELGIDIRIPDPGEGWVPNVAGRAKIGEKLVSKTGWVKDGCSHVTVYQTAASAEKLADDIDGRHRPEVLDAIEVGGHTWERRTGEDKRPLWITDLDGTRVALVGNAASDEQMREMAEALAKADPIEVEVATTVTTPAKESPAKEPTRAPATR